MTSPSRQEQRHRAFVLRALERKLLAAGQGDKSSALPELVRVQAPPGSAPPSPGTGALALKRLEVDLRVSELAVTLNARDGSLLGWSLSAARDGSTRALAEDDALARAQAAADLPGGDAAELAFAGYEDIGGTPFFVAHWEHREGGVLVEKDFIRVVVNGQSGAICAVNRRWHAPDETPGLR